MKWNIKTWTLSLSLLLLSGAAIADKPPKDIMSMDQAKDIALKLAPGEIKSSELEFEMKQWVYSFDIRGTDSKIHEVLVSAKSGKIVSNSIESAAKESKEAKEDKK